MSIDSNSIPIIDLHSISQPELYTLSSSPLPQSNSSETTPNISIPIDRTVFNESLGSRKQTYSRLRLAPPSSLSRRHHHPSTTLLSPSDPVNGENINIIATLKQFFHPGDIIEYPPLVIDDVAGNTDNIVVDAYAVGNLNNNGNNVMKTDMNMNTNTNTNTTFVVGGVDENGKRKRGRGRPRKERDNNVVVVVDKGDAGVGDYEMVADVKMPVEEIVNVKVVGDGNNDVGADKELVNKDGEVVDLVELGKVEHPYWEEIRKRSEGLKSEEELLGFLRGLEGQWGSRRMKRRVVDASEFGNALPVGWKVLLSIKKKSGVVWVNCRRYISPSGQQFISCKEVTSYLLSLNGLQDPNPLAQAQNDVPIKVPSVTEMSQIADPAAQSEITLTPNASSSNPSTKATNSQEARGSENLLCKKCNISFSDKVEFLQHQSSLHPKNRSRNSVSLADGVIMKDGKYECQFCHKVFNERHRYTGHIGAHVRFRDKMAGKLPPGDPISGNGTPIQETTVAGSESVSVNNEVNFSSPCNKENGHVGNSTETTMMDIDEVEATDVTAKTPSIFDNRDSDAPANVSAAEIVDDGSIVKDTGIVTAKAPSAVDNKDFHENSDLAVVNDSPAVIVNGPNAGVASDNCSLLHFDEKTNFVNQVSAPVEIPGQDMLSESNLDNSNNSVEACDAGVNNGDVSQTTNEPKVDGQDFAVNDSVFDFFESRSAQEEDISVGVSQHSNFDELPGNVESSSPSASTLDKCSKLNQGFNLSMPAPFNDEKPLAEENVVLSSKSMDYEKHSFGTPEKRSPERDYVNDRRKEMQFGMGSVIPSWNEQENVSGKYDTESLFNEPVVHKNNESNNDDFVGRKMEVSQFDRMQNIKNSEMSDPFSGSHSALNFNPMSDKDYSREDDNLFGPFNSGLDTNNQKPPGSALFGVSNVRGFSGNEMYSTAINQSKVNEFENSSSELSLSFNNLQKELQTESNMTGTFNILPVAPQNYGNQNIGNANRQGNFLSFDRLHKGMQTESNRADQQKYPRESFNFQSIFPPNYEDQTRSSVVNANAPVDMKQARNFGIDFLDLPFNRTNEVSNSLNFPPSGGNWSGSSGGKTATPGQNLVLGFGSGSQSVGGGMANWATGHGNAFQNCFNNASSPQVQTSTGFGAFNLAHNKGHEGSPYRMNERYNNVPTDTFGSGRSKPVARSEPKEYSFMGEQSSNSMRGDSKMFSYNPSVEQGLGPQFWLGNNALMQNIAPSQVPVPCAWCNSIFYQDPIQSGVQTGAIGSMCPSCSTKLPGFNVL